MTTKQSRENLILIINIIFLLVCVLAIYFSENVKAKMAFGVLLSFFCLSMNVIGYFIAKERFKNDFSTNSASKTLGTGWAINPNHPYGKIIYLLLLIFFMLLLLIFTGSLAGWWYTNFLINL